MAQIRLLSKSVSDKIAAGEVVERPLSLVKELVENAIDAGASAISINIADGGIGEVCVTDNGSGIPANEVRLAFEKHATSKINTESDLMLICTQGFRGEALSSIASVSVVEMKTKTRDDETGTLIRISGGRVDKCEPAGLPDGTSVCVRQLFFNVPARRKFLKKTAQEAAYISDLVSRYILAFPEISFHYTSGGKTVYHSPGNGDLKNAIYAVYGRDIMESITHVSHTAGDIAVSGFVSRPGTVMKNRRAGSVFVNRRYVRSALLHDMVRSAYGETLVKGEFPFFALNIDVPPSAVDVNVHPNKMQVRFRDAAAVEHVIKEAVSDACVSLRGSIAFAAPEAPVKKQVDMYHSPDMTQTELFTGFTRTTLREDQSVVLPDTERGYNTESEDTPKTPVNAQMPESEKIKDEGVQMPADWRIIGTFRSAYILVEQADDLLIIDQHAAHERLNYERFSQQQTAISQPLLTPYVMTVSHAQKNMIDENIDIFTKLGFDIQPFGILEYKIGTVPSVVYGADVETLIADALDEIPAHGADALMRRDKIIMASCKSAVKAGDRLSDTEIAVLIDKFLSTDIAPTCPHGRPVITRITTRQLEKSFKRTL